MALQAILGEPVEFPPLPKTSLATWGNNTFLLDAASEKAANIFQAPKTGNISKIILRTGTVTTGATLDVRLETVDATTGDPSGTLVGTNTNGSLVIADTDDNLIKETTLTAAAAVTRGQWIAVVAVNPAVSFGNLNLWTIEWRGTQWALPAYGDLYTTAWTKQLNNYLVCGVEYADGSYAPAQGQYPLTSIVSNSASNATTPDVIGNRFKVPFACKVNGLYGSFDLDGDADLKLIDSDGVTVLKSVSLDANIRASLTLGFHLALFDTDVTLLKDTYYRVVLEPTTATAVGSIREITMATVARMAASPGGADVHKTTAKDPTGEASWTQTLTSYMIMGVLISALDDGVSAGGGLLTHPGMAGGMRA